MPFQTKKITRIDTTSLETLGDSVTDLAGHVENEFDRLTSALQATEPEKIWTTPPPKPRTGTIVYADGAHWNPGSGEGLYVYGSDGLWHYLEVPAYVPPVVPSQVLLETITFAGAANYATAASWAGYSHIKFIISNMILSAAANTPFLTYHSAGAYPITNYINGASLVGLTATPVFSAAQTATTSMFIYSGTDLTAASIPEGTSIEGTIYNVASTTMHKYMEARSAVRSATTSYYGFATGTWTGGLTAIDGFRLGNSGGGNFNSGKLQVYGVL